jgi:hypothetical protein
VTALRQVETRCCCTTGPGEFRIKPWQSHKASGAIGGASDEEVGLIRPTPGELPDRDLTFNPRR